MAALDLDLMLSSAISKDEAKERADRNQNKLRISRGAYEKIKLYANLTSKITHIGMECYGYLLRPKWSPDDLITNVYFADEQLDQQAHTLVPVEGIRRAMAAVDRMDYEIVGWWHSHGEINTFHSETDKRNFRKVHDGISPHTIFRYEDAPYIVDESNNRVVFENYALTDLSEEELQIFRNRQVKALKKVEQDPYAFSMVVNNRDERYLERITKTMDRATGEFKRNEPVFPRFETVDVENDLEFLVADVEWEVREKIILQGYGSYQQLKWERNNRNAEIGEKIILDANIDDFIDNLTRYVRQRGKYALYAFNILFDGDSDIFKEVAAVKTEDVAKQERKGYTVKVKDERDSIKDNLKVYFEGLSEEKYSMWRQKIHLFDREHILARRFMEEFCETGKKSTNGERSASQSKVFEKYHNLALRLNNSFEIADKAMKAMTKYAMENVTDYSGKRNHRYKNLIGTILTKLCGKDLLSFERAVQLASSSRQSCNRKDIFIWEDRFDICDQLIIDAYQLKSGSIYKSAELAEERKRSLKFFEEFARYYDSEPGKIDELIESEILGRSGVSAKKYSRFSDSNYKRRVIRREAPIFNIYTPGKAVRVETGQAVYRQPKKLSIVSEWLKKIT